MKQLSIHKILIIILLIGSIPELSAQKSKANKSESSKWFVGITGGANVFWGDIKFNNFLPSTKMNEIQPGFDFVFGRTFSPVFNLNTTLNITALNGKKVNLSDTLGFKTQAISIALKAQLNPFALLSKKESKLAFYLESGAGIMAWRNLAENYSTKDTLSNFGWTNSNKKFAFYVPAGIKIEYQISQKFSSYFSSHYNFVFSDLLDGATTGKNDRYSFTALGINYHFGKRKEIPELLPYNYFAWPQDTLAEFPNKQKKDKKQKTEAENENVNPFSFDYKVPETAPHTGFEIEIDIAKIGIPATGFFRLLTPSGFIPQSSQNEEVSFTKLGHRYEYDFILPMNQDSTSITIPIKLSEIEKGTFPILIEGEIMDQKGNVFPIKFATYTEIISEESWYKGLPLKEQQVFDAKKAEEKITKTARIPEDKKTITIKEDTLKAETSKRAQQMKTSDGVYRIQIMASRKAFADLNSFKTKHNIKEEIFISQADGWFRYTLYTLTDINEAKRLCKKVQVENNIPQAFVTHYKNGKRILLTNTQTSKVSKAKKPTVSTSKASSQPIINQTTKKKSISNTKPVYRIEIALSYNQPIPLYLLKNKVGKEQITEFEHNENFYYTIGEFENLDVARAFLDYVKSEFKFENATIAQYQQNKRLRSIF